MEAGLLDPAPIWTDAKTFDARPFRGKVHGIIGGYPCPGESLAGLREGHLYHGFLWPALRRAIAAARPLFCFFENVDDHLTGTYPIVQLSLRNMGYAVEAGIYTAKEAGASHDRQRVFILAILADSNGYVPEGFKGNFYDPGFPDENKKQKRQRGGNEFSNSDQGHKRELAYSVREGLQRSQPGLVRRQRQAISGPVAKCRPQDFPLGQCEYQWDWEEPREVEPGVGSAIHGYNFESDLVRALGNSVVEQQAEIAWIDLMNKHFGNIQSNSTT
jgi:DNA (cytosine-5)-methyltransferase 1